jgi:isoquinoline 1-oxidoreductase alpha subunit
MADPAREFSIDVNGRKRQVTVDPTTPLLWVLRDGLRLTGTKYGCGVGACGSCTVHVDGAPVRSCTLPIEAVAEAKVITIEGLDAREMHPVQVAWRELDVPQCGYCQPGMVMAAAALLKEKPRPTDGDIREGITNLCRCGTYHRVLAGVKRASEIAEGRRKR